MNTSLILILTAAAVFIAIPFVLNRPRSGTSGRPRDTAPPRSSEV